MDKEKLLKFIESLPEKVKNHLLTLSNTDSNAIIKDLYLQSLQKTQTFSSSQLSSQLSSRVSSEDILKVGSFLQIPFPINPPRDDLSSVGLKLVPVKADGHCGYRALATLVILDSNFFPTDKFQRDAEGNLGNHLLLRDEMATWLNDPRNQEKVQAIVVTLTAEQKEGVYIPERSLIEAIKAIRTGFEKNGLVCWLDGTTMSLFNNVFQSRFTPYLVININSMTFVHSNSLNSDAYFLNKQKSGLQVNFDDIRLAKQRGYKILLFTGGHYDLGEYTF